MLVAPPSTITSEPSMKLDSSDARKGNGCGNLGGLAQALQRNLLARYPCIWAIASIA
jgi:hypothetical protein